MKKVIRTALLILVGLSIGFYLSVRYTQNKAFVYLTVENKSSQPIQSLKISHEHGTQTFLNVPIGELRKIKFYAGGTTSYELTAVLSDKTKVHSKRNAEGGYKITAEVFEKRIKTKTRIFYL